LVDSVRGPGGGYTLARLARNITVADIIFAVDEPIDATNCGGKTDCSSGADGRPSACMTHELWAALNRTMVDFLDSVSLQDLVDQQRMRQLQDSGQSRTETSVRMPTRIDSAADPFARKANESVTI
jgi:Rrf2 family iron-sulfur cluster assembly transcriptional regulator